MPIVYYYDSNNDNRFLYEAEQDNSGATQSFSVSPINPEHFYKPKWDNSEWVESGTDQEVSDHFTQKYMAQLQESVSVLLIKAKAVSMEKEGDSDYIRSQEEFYELKYRISTGDIVNVSMEAMMLGEAIEFFADNNISVPSGHELDTFKNIVITIYEYGMNVYHVFKYIIERCRTHIQHHILRKEWLNTRNNIALFNTLLDDPTQASTIMSNILNT